MDGNGLGGRCEEHLQTARLEGGLFTRRRTNEGWFMIFFFVQLLLFTVVQFIRVFCVTVRKMKSYILERCSFWLKVFGVVLISTLMFRTRKVVECFGSFV